MVLVAGGRRTAPYADIYRRRDKQSRSLTADSNALTFTVSGLSPLRTVLLYTYVIGSPLLTVLIPLIMIAITIKKTVRNRREASHTAAENSHKELEKD